MLQQEVLEDDTQIIIYDREDDILKLVKRFKRYWGKYKFPCQNYDSFEAIFLAVPNFNQKRGSGINHSETKMIWVVSELMKRIKVIWKIAT